MYFEEFLVASNDQGLVDYLSSFKKYLSDVGLLRKKAGLSGNTLLIGNRLFTEFKGSLMENSLLQELILQFDTIPRYWISRATAKVDFILQYENNVYPVEVKSGRSNYPGFFEK